MTRVEVVAILGSLGLLAIVFELIRRKQLAEGYSLLWLLAAGALLVLSLWRELLVVLAHLTGIFYAPAALFVVAIGFVLLILLQFSVVISRLSQENKELAQQVGLLNWKLSQLQGKDADDDIQEDGSPQHDDSNADLGEV